MFDHHNRTPLNLAVLNNHYKWCKLLLENYGNPFLTDYVGKKRIDFATDQKMNSLWSMHMDVTYKNQLVRDKLVGMFKYLEDKKIRKAFELKLWKIESNQMLLMIKIMKIF